MAKSGGVLFYRQNKLLRYDGKEIKDANFSQTKELFCGAVVPLHYLKVVSFKLPKNLSKEELDMQVEIKMYNEGGLDAEKEYVIDYLSFESGEELVVEAYAFLEEDLPKALGENVKKLSAIDLLFPRFLIYQTLYEQNETTANGCDIYIYVDEEEAFGALYYQGRYIGYRNINSLSSLSKRTGIELAKLKEYLQTKGFVRSNYDLEEMHIIDTVQEVFLKDIEKLVYSVSHKRSIFGVEGIEKVYVDFYSQSLQGLEEFFAPFGYPQIKIEPISLPEHTPSNVNTDITLSCRYLLLAQDEKNELQRVNLTPMARKKPLVQYEAFGYIVAVAVSLLLVVGGYVYLSYMNASAKEELVKEKRLEKEHKRKVADILKRYKELKAQNKALQEKMEKIDGEIFVYETTIEAVPMVQEQKLKRQRFMNDILSTLAKYKLNTKYIRQKDAKEMDIMLISQSRNRETISRFMEDLLEMGYSKVYTDKIYNEYGVYMSNVKVFK